jgi:hypothetical protein
VRKEACVCFEVILEAGDGALDILLEEAGCGEDFGVAGGLFREVGAVLVEI